MKLDEVAKIADLMTQHDLTEFVIECEELKLRLKRQSPNAAVAPAPMLAPMPTVVQALSPDAATAAAGRAAAPAEPPAAQTIDSPIVGTFYSAPSPDAPAFVKVGQTVTPDTVVCIVEAMKVMNEIKAGKHAVIKKILAENARPVEFGQPLFEVTPA